jgi:glycerol kinase
MTPQIGMGLYRSPDELTALPRAERVFHPGMSPGQVAENYDGWQRAVRGVLSARHSREEIEAIL